MEGHEPPTRGRLREGLPSPSSDGARETGRDDEKLAHLGPIGAASLSVPGDETKTVKIDIDAAGRALLSTDHGRCSASLEILELAPNPENTQTKTVHLVQRKAHGKTGKK